MHAAADWIGSGDDVDGRERVDDVDESTGDVRRSRGV